MTRLHTIQPRYIVDTCSFAELRRTYPQDVFPDVWKLIGRLAQAGVVASVEDVLLELATQDDEVHQWALARKSIFQPLDIPIQSAVLGILQTHPTLVDMKHRKSSADPFVIAAAQLHSATVVTQEKFSGGPPKVKIPDVCRDLGIPCIDILTLLRREH